MAQKRTTHRSSKGTKLYAVRNADGTFKDVQSYKRAHAADVRASAKGETSAKSKAVAAKKTVKKTVKKAAKKVAKKATGLVAKAKKVIKRAVRKVAS